MLASTGIKASNRASKRSMLPENTASACAHTRGADKLTQTKRERISHFMVDKKKSPLSAPTAKQGDKIRSDLVGHYFLTSQGLHSAFWESQELHSLLQDLQEEQEARAMDATARAMERIRIIIIRMFGLGLSFGLAACGHRQESTIQHPQAKSLTCRSGCPYQPLEVVCSCLNCKKTNQRQQQWLQATRRRFS
jgi:hypothetical protein